MRRTGYLIVALALLGLVAFAVVTPAGATPTCTGNPAMLAYSGSSHAYCSQSVNCQTTCSVTVTASVTGFGLVGVLVDFYRSGHHATASCGPAETMTCKAEKTASNITGAYTASCRGISLLAVREMIFCTVSVSPAG